MRVKSKHVQAIEHNRRLRVAGALAALLCLILFSAALAYSLTPGAGQPVLAPSGRPGGQVPSDQAEQGAQVYTERCSTCHGDVGQGLTDEFRMTWAEGDRNCWVPGCHGANPPKPGGFTIPRVVPALVGPATLARFATAKDLHDFARAAMPMQEPGVLSDEQYWAVTAFLLRANGVPAGGRRLDATTAGDVPVPRTGQPVPKPPRTPDAAAPLSAREIAPPMPRRMPPPSFTPEAPGIAVAQQPSAVQPAGLGTARSAGNPAAAAGPGGAAVWLAALVLVLVGAIILAGRGQDLR